MQYISWWTEFTIIVVPRTGPVRPHQGQLLAWVQAAGTRLVAARPRVPSVRSGGKHAIWATNRSHGTHGGLVGALAACEEFI